MWDEVELLHMEPSVCVEAVGGCLLPSGRLMKMLSWDDRIEACPLLKFGRN